MKRKEFDPLQYIEDAFLDKSPAGRAKGTNGGVGGLDVAIPAIDGYLHSGDGAAKGKRAAGRFRKTKLSAPRPRRAKKSPPAALVDTEMQRALPRSIEFLLMYFDDGVTANYYRGNFKESRADLIKRLLDPELTLEEVSRLLGVCPATVRRYTNRNWISHHRTKGGQRRFRLSDVVKFVEAHGRLPEE